MDLEITKAPAVTEPQAQLNIGATFTLKDPPGDKQHGHLDARDPITGKVTWSVDFPEPPTASLLSTAGGLVFVPDARGWLHAMDSKTGKDLWQGNDGATHNGGIISYEAGGKQYIAVVTGGPSLVGEGYAEQFGGPYKTHGKGHGLARRLYARIVLSRASVPIEPEPGLWRFSFREPFRRVEGLASPACKTPNILFRLVK